MENGLCDWHDHFILQYAKTMALELPNIYMCETILNSWGP